MLNCRVSNKMTATEIITTFELIVNDVTELSTSEELALLNRVYNRICTERPWEFLKTQTSGTMSGSGDGGFYITTPSDFAYFVENNQYTDNAIGIQNNAAPKVIYVGSNYTPYQIVNFSDRRSYRTVAGYAYLDLANSKIYFTGTPLSTTYEFDYLKVPAALTAGDTPVIPTRFQPMLAFGMASENDILQLSPKATSYAPENQAKYLSYLQDMSYWNSLLILN